MMISARRCWQATAILVLVLGVPAAAQVNQFLPEVDVYSNLTPGMRLWLQAKDVREDGEPNGAEIGPSLDFYLKSLVDLKNVTGSDMDDAKRRIIVLSAGYRYVPSSGKSSDNRILLMATSNLPLKTAMVVSDRNRLEINFNNGSTYWRYRNRVTLERSIPLRSYHPSLTAAAEFYYNSKYGKWSSTSLYAGAIFPIGHKTEIEPYYEHENNTAPHPNQQINALGLIFNLYFRRESQ